MEDFSVDFVGNCSWQNKDAKLKESNCTVTFKAWTCHSVVSFIDPEVWALRRYILFIEVPEFLGIFPLEISYNYFNLKQNGCQLDTESERAQSIDDLTPCLIEPKSLHDINPLWELVYAETNASLRCWCLVDPKLFIVALKEIFNQIEKDFSS